VLNDPPLGRPLLRLDCLRRPEEVWRTTTGLAMSGTSHVVGEAEDMEGRGLTRGVELSIDW